MRVWYLATLFVAIALFFSASVYAECAWILWENFEVHKMEKNQKIGKKESDHDERKWEAKSAFPASTAGLTLCINIMKQSIKHTKEKWESIWGKDNVFYSAASVSGGEESVSVLTPDEFKSYSYRCLPDTMNLKR